MFRLSLVGFLTSGLFLGRAYFDYYFCIVACIIVLKHICQQDWAAGCYLGEPEPPAEEMLTDEFALAREKPENGLCNRSPSTAELRLRANSTPP